jgi:hypothetical protein
MPDGTWLRAITPAAAQCYATAHPQYWPIKYGGYTTTPFGLSAN